ncbi:MAG: hypothetical protein A2Z83_06900 [Omnitrophica bacterium GWA2_52_8]|nr:MAG: hypothetical protein A2Z83_06900 [Omnitrophica bacterium GWA2_52_8]
MKLYLMRHGQAVNAMENVQRPLSQSGRLEAENIAKQFRTQKIKLREIWSSPLKRAAETAGIVAECCGVSGPKITHGLLPDDPPAGVEEKIICFAAERKNGPLLIVSHLPLVACLLRNLAGAKGFADAEFPPARVFGLEYNGRCWTAAGSFTPEL